MKDSKIEWTTHTFNPWKGCTKISAGCANCYAERQSHRNPAVLGNWGKGAPRVPASEAKWNEVLQWHRKAEKAWKSWDYERRVCDANGIEHTQPEPERERVFCASMADWLDEEVPIEWLARLLDLINTTPFLDWLLLTKRPQNFFPRVSEATGWGTDNIVCPPNVWVGTSVENQEAADARIPQLLKIPARVRFLSCEPLLDRVSIVCVQHEGRALYPLPQIHWVIAGGESGPKARPMHSDWSRSLREQCRLAKVPFLFKQWGEWMPQEHADASPDVQAAHDARRTEGWPGHKWPDATLSLRVGKKLAGRNLDGVIHHAFPTPA